MGALASGSMQFYFSQELRRGVHLRIGIGRWK